MHLDYPGLYVVSFPLVKCNILQRKINRKMDAHLRLSEAHDPGKSEPVPAVDAWTQGPQMGLGIRGDHGDQRWSEIIHNRTIWTKLVRILIRGW